MVASSNPVSPTKKPHLNFKIGRLPGQQVQFVSEPPWSVVCDNGFGTIGTVSPQNLDRAALYDNHVTGSFSSADSHAPASTT